MLLGVGESLSVTKKILCDLSTGAQTARIRRVGETWGYVALEEGVVSIGDYGLLMRA